MIQKIKHRWDQSRLIDKMWVGGLIIGSLVVLSGIFFSNQTPEEPIEKQASEEEELMM